jgi:plastocyanin
MKKKVVIVAVILAGVFGLVFLSAFLSPRETVIVIMNDDGFEPYDLTIEKGTRVEFVNRGENDHWPASDFHPTHGIYPEFDPQEGVAPGASWSFDFEKAGKWRMHDHLFPGYRGTITVTE